MTIVFFSFTLSIVLQASIIVSDTLAAIHHATYFVDIVRPPELKMLNQNNYFFVP